VRPASIPVLRERSSICVLEEEPHVRLSVAAVLIARTRRALGGTFKQRQSLPLHPLEGRSTALINHYRAPISCDLADHNLLVEVAHTITDRNFVKVDFPWKLTTHVPLMLVQRSSSGCRFVALVRICLHAYFSSATVVCSAPGRATALTRKRNADTGPIGLGSREGATRATCRRAIFGKLSDRA
jgi:hypothetical protein